MKNKLFVDFSWIVFFILLFIFLKLSVIGFYLVPSPSMLPNLVPGDRILANKLAYGFTPPFFNTTLFQWSFPTRGDIILFSFENNSDIYVKRVIGLPGDLITFKEGQVFINDVPLTLTMTLQKNIDSNFSLYGEQNSALLNKPHTIYMSKEPDRTFFESRRFLVPPGKLFVLGDNRDNSADSRVYGYVDTKNVYGRASYVFFSTTGESFFPKFRGDRTMLNINP
jgi:signal peptidase I